MDTLSASRLICSNRCRGKLQKWARHNTLKKCDYYDGRVRGIEIMTLRAGHLRTWFNLCHSCQIHELFIEITTELKMSILWQVWEYFFFLHYLVLGLIYWFLLANWIFYSWQVPFSNDYPGIHSLHKYDPSLHETHFMLAACREPLILLPRFF